MRIISGSHKGRRYRAPSNIPARPTTDYAKESLFNILDHSLEWKECCMLDLFAGIAGISLEAASRGCKEIRCVDLNIKSVSWIKKISSEFGFDSIKPTKSDSIKWLKRNKLSFDFVFADPPYDYNDYPLLIEQVLKTALKPSGVLVLEHRQSNSFANHQNYLEHRTYGEVRFSFFELKT